MLCKDREDAALQKAMAETERYPPRVKLLSTLQGGWDMADFEAEEGGRGRGPGSPLRVDFRRLVLRNLYMLYEYFTPPADSENVDAALENILSWQHEDGYIMGPEPDMLPRPSHIGLAMCVLHRFEKATGLTGREASSGGSSTTRGTTAGGTSRTSRMPGTAPSTSTCGWRTS